MIFEKMLVGYAPLDKPDALLLGELSNQNVKVGNLLVRSRKTMIYDKMDSLRIPDLLNAHLTENLDRQRSGTVLSHGHVHWQNGNLARKVDLPASVSLDANDLLSKCKRIIVENRLGQISREAGRKLPLLKMKLKRPQCILVMVESEKMHGEVFKAG